MPNLTEEYDAIGFDADHCVIKYNVKELTSLIIKITLEDLYMKERYPVEMLNMDSGPESTDI